VDSPLGRLESRCFPAALAPDVSLAVRPEHIEISDAAPDGAANVVAGVIERELFSGKLIEYAVRVADTVVRAQCTSMARWAVGAPVTLRLPPERCVIVNGAPEEPRSRAPST
jgi:ABC-type Fe3+/spermidine/putrescine transport system ATPase subunit